MAKNKYINGVVPMLLINFSIGSVYCWTLMKEHVLEYTQFNPAVAEWCFSLAIVFLGLTAAFGGKVVEKSAKTSSWITFVMFTSGWLLTGFGIQSKNPVLAVMGFGVVQGIGLGFGYLTPVKTLMVWFGKRKGFAAGLAITGFGLAGVIANPIIAGLLETIPVYMVFYVLAGIYGVALIIASLLIHRPESTDKDTETAAPSRIDKVNTVSLLLNKKFIMLWLALFINISCGLALISQEKQIYHLLGVSSMGAIVAFCSANATGNLLGRLCMASLQDKLDYKHIPYYLMAACSLAVCGLLVFFPTELALTVAAIFVVQFFFGCGFSCLPNILHQNYGMKRLATVHGLMLSAWAAAGLFGNQLAAYTMRNHGLSALYMALGVLFVAELIIFLFWTKAVSRKWETKENAVCADCGCECTGYRIVEWLGYDRKDDGDPEYRCSNCKDAKLLQVRSRLR